MGQPEDPPADRPPTAAPGSAARAEPPLPRDPGQGPAGRSASLPGHHPGRHPGRHPGLGTGAHLWLFRHAEVHEDWQGHAYGGLDVPLSAVGERNTERIAAEFGGLGFSALASSPLQRARRLGEGLARRAGTPLVVEDDLREIDRGAWQGRTVAALKAERGHEVAAFHADPWSWREHGGEADADVLARAWPALERTVRRAAEAGGAAPLAGLVSHYNVTRVLVSRLLGIEPGHSFRFRVDTGGATLLVDGPGGWRLLRSNVRSPAAAGSGRGEGGPAA